MQTDTMQTDAMQTNPIQNLHGVVFTRKNDAMQTKNFIQTGLHIVVFSRYSDTMQTRRGSLSEVT